MLKTIAITSALLLSTSAFAADTPEDAKAMLAKAVAAMKADPTLALIQFVKGEGGFLDGNLYPFCMRIADETSLATPKAVKAGTKTKTLKDAAGRAYGEELVAAAKQPEGTITEVGPYQFPKPGTTEPLFAKISYVTRVNGEFSCGVGYYK
jgi:Single Cache domain 2